MKIATVLALVFLLALSPAIAAVVKDDSTGIYRLQEIVVTATRLPLTASMLSFSSDVISSEEIDLSDANSATGAIESMPGIFVQKTGDFGRSDPYIRGFGDMGRRIGVLVDGHPVKMGLFGCTITHALPLSNISRIEIIRSPASVLYGSDALGGVINIITSDIPITEEIKAQTSYGSFKTTKNNLLYANRIGKIGYTISLDRRQSDGHLDNSAYEGTDISSRILFDISPTRISLFAKYFDGHKEEPARVIPYDSTSNVWNDYARGTVDLEVSRRIGRSLLSLKAYDEFGEHRFSDGWHSKDHSFGMIFYGSTKILDRGDIGAGIDFRRQSGKRLSNPPGKWDKTEFGGYGFSRISILRQLSATIGLRLNNDEISGFAFSPHLGLILKPANPTTLRVAVSKGYRSPQINELYMFPSSNTDLSEETVWGYEVAIDQNIGRNQSVSVTGFILKGTDFIDLKAIPNPPPKFRFENIGEIDFRGIESTLRLNPTRWLRGRISYTYLDTNGKTKGRPEDKFNLDLLVDFGMTRLSISSETIADYYADNDNKQRISDYTVTDLKISRMISLHGSAFITINNIFDENYQVYVEIPGNPGVYQMPGRRYQAGLSFEWSRD
ncbi:MAG: TonB-dependent receptor [bacterium]